MDAQAAGNRMALEAQATESRDGRRHAEALARADREHALALAREDRLWARRADLYTSILEAMRRRIEGREPSPPAPPDDPRLTSLATQAHVLASGQVQECLNEFVYDGPDHERQVDIWDDLQHVVHRELGIPRD